MFQNYSAQSPDSGLFPGTKTSWELWKETRDPLHSLKKLKDSQLMLISYRQDIQLLVSFRNDGDKIEDISLDEGEDDVKYEFHIRAEIVYCPVCHAFGRRLYRAFCELTGFDGTVRKAEVAPAMAVRKMNFCQRSRSISAAMATSSLAALPASAKACSVASARLSARPKRIMAKLLVCLMTPGEEITVAIAAMPPTV